MSDTSELAVVRAFSLPLEAHLACSALHAAGLEARVADQDMVTADWLLSNAIGGVKVLVRAEDLATAREVLENIASVSDDDAVDGMSDVEDAAQDVCPQCGGRTWVSVTHGKRLAVLSWMVISFPLFPVWRRWRCSDCGHESRWS